jgi:hypothetical protein
MKAIISKSKHKGKLGLKIGKVRIVRVYLGHMFEGKIARLAAAGVIAGIMSGCSFINNMEVEAREALNQLDQNNQERGRDAFLRTCEGLTSWKRIQEVVIEDSLKGYKGARPPLHQDTRGVNVEDYLHRFNASVCEIATDKA